MAIRVSSSAFKQDETIPRRYTCDGDDVSPAVAWSGISLDARALALIVHDPDAPGGDFTHWVLFDMPPGTSGVPEGGPLPEGARRGKTDFGRSEYGGPCPPPGAPHRYIFTVYALDAPLGLSPGATRGAVLDAMDGHILAEGQLTGRYGR